MLVEELDPPLIDTLGNVLADLVRGTALDHIEGCPAIFCLGTRRSTDKEGVPQLALKVVLFDVVREEGRDFPTARISMKWYPQ
jgi:hypothetical protein